MSAYLLANITVNNPENYKEYVSKVKSVVEKFGGEYLVRGGEMNIIEGDWPNERNIGIKFATGDLVEESEDGYLRVIGRKNDVINVGGLKVMPSEIENVINLVDGVIDASVYGAENIITGNMVCCKIVKKEGYDSKALKVSIRKFCKLKLESYKIPSKFIFEENLRFSNRFKKL